MTVLIALLAFFLVFVEYNSIFPSIVAFRDAPPLNRLRFAVLFVMVLLLTLICKGRTDVTLTTSALTSVATLVGDRLDFPFSPVRLVVLSLPLDVPERLVDLVRAAAGLTYVLSLAAIATFSILVRLFGWPSWRGEAFNVWINLPLFDPTAGGDALHRLQRDARVSIALGVMLPFIIPALVKAGGGLLGSEMLDDSQTLIWMLTAWAFLPASLIMRGIALTRISNMIQEKRRRSYAQDDTDLQPA
ncbi:MAG: hypothetical protein AAF218_11650 [Pseudomonadota bacterium]